jgi:hypothetical protein
MEEKMSFFKRLTTNVLMEWPVQGKNLADLAQTLQTAGEKLKQKVAAAPDTETNRQTLSHIIGIERWGQKRLKVALGEPLTTEEYDQYRPGRDTSWADLQQQFAQTRQESVTLVQQLQQAQVDPGRKIKHNGYGDLTVRGWLRYLTFHANAESWRIR